MRPMTTAVRSLTSGLARRLYDDQNKLWAYQGYQFTLQTGGAQVKRYKGGLHLFDSSWTFQQSDDVYVTTDGDYTFTINGSCSNVYGLYLDIEKLLKDHPNCDVKVVAVKADGKSVDFDDAAIDRVVGDAATTTRRYIVNPWGANASTAANYSFNFIAVNHRSCDARQWQAFHHRRCRC